jgi:hypothetical protein
LVAVFLVGFFAGAFAVVFVADLEEPVAAFPEAAFFSAFGFSGLGAVAGN